MQYAVIADILLLLVVANGAPIIARDLFGTRADWPLDFGWTFLDGRPLLGPSKTIRGVVAAGVSTGCAAEILGIQFNTGAVIGLWAMLGDTGCSFLKRRLGVASSDSALGLDQGLEALVPVLAIRSKWSLSLVDVLFILILFFILDILLSRLLYKVHIRKRPL